MKEKKWVYLKEANNKYKLYRDGKLVNAKTGAVIKPRIKGNNQHHVLNIAEGVVTFSVNRMLKQYFGISSVGLSKVRDLPGEIWGDIPEYEGVYQVSSEGRVKRINKEYVGEHLLTPNVTRKGSLQVTLTKNNIKSNLLVHRLVGRVLIPNPNNNPMIIHLDGVKTNNRTSNLKWVDNSEAQQLANDLGLIIHPQGEDNPCSIMINQYEGDCVTYIRTWGCITDVERELGIQRPNICKVLKGHRARAGGYHWRYVDEEDV